MTGLLAAPPILLSASFIGLVGSILLARNSEYGERAPAKAVPIAWLAAAVLQAFASFGHALRGELPPSVVFSAVNAVQLLALALLWLGASRMVRRSVPGWVAFLPPLVWLMACLVPGFMETQRVRLLLYAPLAYGAAIWTVIDLLGIYRRHRVRAARDMAVLVGVVTLILLSVIALTIVFPRGSDGPQLLFTGVPALMTALYGTTLPFLMLAVSREWDALEQGARRAQLLQAGRAEVERLHGGLPALIFVREIDADGGTRLLYRGGNVEAVTGYSPEALANVDNLTELAADRQPLANAMETARRFGAASVDWPMKRPDGRGVAWLRTSWRVEERRPDGSLILIGYSINITAEREANARASAVGRLASLGEMATGLAHELMQPLQVIMTGTEIAQAAARRIDASAIDVRLERVIGQVVRAQAIIDNLRRFARGELAGAPVQIIRVETVIENVMVLIGGLLRDAGIEVATDLPDDARAVLGHPVALEQVLTNLLINARDALATCPKGAPRRVTLSTEAADGLVRLRVSDTGGGIPPEIAERVFEPFVTTKAPDKGTGIGLSIAHGLVTAMGGTINVTNGAEGAVFTITLPCSPTGEAPPAST